MGHKTKEQRQQEAKERNRAYLDKPESWLRDMAKLADEGNAWAIKNVDATERALVTAYVNAGYTKLEAEGMARSVRHGGSRNSWST